jgi:hypothetical protein
MVVTVVSFGMRRGTEIRCDQQRKVKRLEDAQSKSLQIPNQGRKKMEPTLACKGRRIMPVMKKKMEIGWRRSSNANAHTLTRSVVLVLVLSTLKGSPLPLQLHNFSFRAQSFLEREDKYYSIIISRAFLLLTSKVKMVLRLIHPSMLAFPRSQIQP